MINIIVAFPGSRDAAKVKTLLVRSGFHVSAECVSGAAVLQASDRLYTGIVICGLRLQDMNYHQLREALPQRRSFPMLVVGSVGDPVQRQEEGVTFLPAPLKVLDLVEGVRLLEQDLSRFVSAGHNTLRRSSEDRRQIALAKEKLMEKNHMTEEQAHRYLQKTSMDNGTNMTETARMILSLMA